MSNKVGAKSKLTEEEVNNIIYLFRTEPGGSPSGKIKAAAIHEFADELHSEGRVRNSPSLDFWYKPGRLGTKVLDEFNKVDASELPLPDGKTVSVPKIKDLVEKKYKNKDELIDNLTPLEDLAHKLVDRINSLSNKLQKSQNENAMLKKDKDALNNKIDDLEQAVFKLFRYIQLDSSDETKAITIRALKDIYKNPNPIDYFKTFEPTGQSLQNDDATPEKNSVSSLTDILNTRFKAQSTRGQQ